MAKGVTFNLHVEGAGEVLAALRDLPAEASDRLREAAGQIAGKLLPDIRSAARADRSPQAALAASTVKVRRDRLPVIGVGGSKRLGKRRAPAWKLLFGSEFGSNRHRQFHKRHRGTTGSWFFGSVEREAETITQEWADAVQGIVDDFGGG